MSAAVATPDLDDVAPDDADASLAWSPLVYRVARTVQGVILFALLATVVLGFAGVGPLATIEHSIHEGLVEIGVIDGPVAAPPFDPLNGQYGTFPEDLKPDIGEGATGDSVLYLEAVLTQRAGQTLTAVDNVYGPDTTAAVSNVQGFFGLPRTGAVDTATWRVIDLAATGPAG